MTSNETLVVQNLLRLIIADASEFPVNFGSDEAEAERDALLSIKGKAKKALALLEKEIA